MSAVVTQRAPSSAPTTALAVLRATREILSGEGTWLPAAPFGGMTAYGKRRGDSRDPDAVRFGAMGAMRRAGGHTDVRMGAEILLARVVGVRYFMHWEEVPGRTEAEVLTAIEAAITLAEIDEACP